MILRQVHDTNWKAKGEPERVFTVITILIYQTHATTEANHIRQLNTVNFNAGNQSLALQTEETFVAKSLFLKDNWTTDFSVTFESRFYHIFVYPQIIQVYDYKAVYLHWHYAKIWEWPQSSTCKININDTTQMTQMLYFVVLHFDSHIGVLKKFQSTFNTATA